MNRLTEVQAAYMAAIIDGEGHIAISKRPPNKKRGETSPGYMPYLKIGSTDPRLLSWISDVVGVGSIYMEKRWSEKIKPFYTWHVSNIQVEDLLRQVYPFLVIKKEQADLILELRSTVAKNTVMRLGTPPEVLLQRDRCFTDLAALHKRKFLPSHMVDLP